jgi:hypothetical protein
MRNLLNETTEILNRFNKSTKDVKWVGCIEFKTTWENFEKIADKKYDAGYGGEEVARDLLIVGENWWLERHEYDGSEWWEFKSLPIEPKAQIEIKSVFTKDAEGYSSELMDCNSLTKEIIAIEGRETIINNIVS